jgi:hypothetical protein
MVYTKDNPTPEVLTQRRAAFATYMRGWRHAHTEEQRDFWSHYKRKEKYGLSRDDFAQLLAATDGHCPICHDAFDEPENGIHRGGPAARSLAVDHDHATGRVRGLLCNNCNKGIGIFRDDIDTLKAAIAYLEKVNG